MRNRRLVAGGMTVVALGALLYGLSQGQRAVEQAAAAADAVEQLETVSAANQSAHQTAESAATAASDMLLHMADLNTQVAAVAATSDANLRAARIAQMESQVREARRQLSNGEPMPAIELALASLQYYGDDSSLNLPTSRSLLLDALAQFHEQPTLLAHSGNIGGAAYNADHSRILTWSSDGTARIWDSGGAPLLVLYHADDVNGAAFNRDSSRVLTWSADGSAVIWDANSGAALFALRHADSVTNALWSPDETVILTLSEETLYLWNADGTPRSQVHHADTILGARWRNDGREILSWSRDNTARVWELPTLTERLLLREVSPVRGADWDATGTRIFTGLSYFPRTNEFSGLRAWDATTGAEVPWNELGYTAANLSPDQTQFMVRPNNGTVRILNAVTGTELYVLGEGRAAVGKGSGSPYAVWSDDGKWLMVRLADGANVLDARTGELRIVLKQNIYYVLSFTVHGDTLITSEEDASRVWSLATGEMLTYLAFTGYPWQTGSISGADGNSIVTWSTSPTQSAAFLWDVSSRSRPGMKEILSSDGLLGNLVWSSDETLLIARSDSSVTVIDVERGVEIQWFEHPADSYVELVRTNNASSQVMTLDDSNVVRTWSIASGELVLDLHHDEASDIEDVRWNPTETRILTRAEDGMLYIWDVRSGELELTISPGISLGGARWSADSAALLTWSEGGTVQTWDATTGEERLRIDYKSQVLDAQWNGAGTEILVRIADRTVLVSDALTGHQRLQFEHDALVGQAMWSADESRMMTRSEDGMARIWNALTGDELVRLEHDAPVRSALWNKDETRILTTANDGVARIWDSATGEELLRLESDAISAVWNADETRIITRSGGTLRIWDAETGLHLLSYGGAETAAWLPETERVFEVIRGDIVRIYTPPEALTTAELIEVAQARLHTRIMGNARRDFYLPPVSIQTSQATALPSVTPAPVTASTLLPSLTPSQTLTPTVTRTASPTVSPTPTPMIGGVLQANTPARGEIGVGGSQSWTYSGTVGEVVTIHVMADLPKRNGPADNPTGLDTVLIVRLPDGEILVSIDDINPQFISDSAVENLVLPVSGTYDLEVRSFEDLSSGEYTISIESSATVLSEPVATAVTTLEPTP